MTSLGMPVVCWKCLGAKIKPLSKRVYVAAAAAAAAAVASSAPPSSSSTTSSPTSPHSSPPPPISIPCPVCQGKGELPPKRLRPARAPSERTRHVAPGYVPPGPDVAGVPAVLREGEELSSLVGRWKLIQLRGGHRWSTDDLLTAFVAKHALSKPPVLHVDLGCGIGSVLSMILFSFPSLHSVGVEAQEMSVEMAKRSLVYNGALTRAELINCDLRNFGLLAQNQTEGPFDLVTGTPPYFGVTRQGEKLLPVSGSLPSFAQSAPARYEIRGGIGAYVEAAGRLVTSAGRVVLCEGDLNPKKPTLRVEEAAALAGLHRIDTVLVHGKEGKPALFAVHVLARSSPLHPPMAKDPRRFVVRGADSKRTAEYNAMCEDMGIPAYIE